MGTKNRIEKRIDVTELLAPLKTARKNPDNELELSISVDKGYHGGCIEVTATLNEIDGHFLSHMMFQDYSETVATKPCKRVTAKAVQAMAEEFLTDDFIDTIKAKMVTHYTK